MLRSRSKKILTEKQKKKTIPMTKMNVNQQNMHEKNFQNFK